LSLTRKRATTIRECSNEDFTEMWYIINDSVQAYKSIITDDRWREPYMPEEELREEIAAGVCF
jgi:hypothetical protein